MGMRVVVVSVCSMGMRGKEWGGGGKRWARGGGGGAVQGVRGRACVEGMCGGEQIQRVII